MQSTKTGIGLRQGVALFSLAATIFPILVISALFISYYKSSALSDINKENMHMAVAIRNDVNIFLNSSLRTVTSVAKFSLNPGLAQHLDYLISQATESHGLFDCIMLLDKAGIVRNLETKKNISLNRNEYLGIDLSKSANVETASRLNRYTWSDAFISPVTGKPIISLTNPFEKGTVIGSIDLRDLSRIVAPEKNGARIQSFLVDGKGRIIAHRDHDKVLRMDNVSDIPAVKAGLSGQEGAYEYEDNGISLISAVVMIPETGWLVVVERDRDEVMTLLRSMEQVPYLVLVALLLLVLIFIIYINSRVITPIIAISNATMSVTDGSFTASTSGESGFREFNELTMNFNTMVEAILQRENELQDKNMELEQEIEERAKVEESLKERNEELISTEDKLRAQVVEYIQTHDQLLATEEMLRVNLEMAEESSQKFKAVFEHSPITVALTTLPDGKFHEVNKAFTDTFGYHQEEVIGKTTLELGVWLHESDRNRYLQLLRENNFVSNFEAQMRRKGGEEFTVFFSGALLEIAGIPFALSAVMDVSEQKRLQDQLLHSQKMDVVGQLAGGVAHDFNNMLTGIMASAEILKLRLPSDDRNHRMLDIIIDATNRSADLSRELLAFSRKETVVSSPVRVHDTIAAVMSLLERTIDKQIHLSALLVAGNPAVMGDQTQLQNALLNLGINARDAMPNGGTLTYSTTVRILDEAACRSMGISLPSGSYLEIAVSDTGEGMTKAVMEHIFEPFFTTKGVGKGTGLGLAAVYGTVRSHQGELYVQSELGVGTVFKIYLPMIEETAPPVYDVEVVAGKGGILLVDDEEILREVGRELLEDLGYTVYLAENGAHALEVFATYSDDISLVMLDIIMPKMGGKEAFTLLREQTPDLKVLFCSGFHQEGTADQLLQLGANGYIQKPYNRGDLSLAVADALGQA